LKTYLSLLALTLSIITFALALNVHELRALPPTGTQPSTQLGIDFTNKGETAAYIHWTLPPGLTSSPGSVNFGSIFVGERSSINLIILNDGPVIIQLQPFSISGPHAQDFSFLSQCPAYLDPNLQCRIIITFKPSAIGAREATLTIPFAGIAATPPASMQIIVKQAPEPPQVTGTVH
jgi:hypothetical protein